MHRINQFAFILVFAISAASCDDGGVMLGVPQRARVQIVNAAEIDNVQVRRVGSSALLAQGLNFRGSTQTCVEVPSGEHALIFTAAGSSLVDLGTTAATFQGDRNHTAFLVAAGGVRRALVLSDEVTASAGNNALRFINATSTAGDVYVTPPGGAIGAAFLAVGNLGALALGDALPDYVQRSTAHTQVRLFNVGTTTGTPRVDFTLTGLPTSRLATVVFTDAGTPPGPTAFMVTPCT